jgi:hypothetical protein
MNPAFLRAPIEVRLKIYHYLFTEPKISVYDADTPLNPKRVKRAGAYLRRLETEDDPPGADQTLAFRLLFEDYDWPYLLTCRKFNDEAQSLLPRMLHLRIMTKQYQVQHIPPDVRRRYLPHIPTLTIAGRFPLYNTVFDGSNLPRLKTLYLLDEGCRSRTVLHQTLHDQSPEDRAAQILGALDRSYVARGLQKLNFAKINWWQCGPPKPWLHQVLGASLPRTFQMIVQQCVFIRFELQTNQHTRGYKWVLLVRQANWNLHVCPSNFSI